MSDTKKYLVGIFDDDDEVISYNADERLHDLNQCFNPNSVVDLIVPNSMKSRPCIIYSFHAPSSLATLKISVLSLNCSRKQCLLFILPFRII